MRSILFVLSAATLTACSVPTEPSSSEPADTLTAPELAPEQDLGALVDRFNELEARLSQAESTAQAAVDALANTNQILAAAITDVSAIEGHIDTLDSIVVTQGARLSDAEGSITNLQAADVTVDTRMSNLNGRADALEAQDAVFDAADASFKTEFGALQAADAAFQIVNDQYASYFSDHSTQLAAQAEAIGQIDMRTVSQGQSIDEAKADRMATSDRVDALQTAADEAQQERDLNAEVADDAAQAAGRAERNADQAMDDMETIIAEAHEFEARIAAEEQEVVVVENVESNPNSICLVGPIHEQLAYEQLPGLMADEMVLLRHGNEAFFMTPQEVVCGADLEGSPGPIVKTNGKVFIDASMMDDYDARGPSSASWAIVRSR